MNGWLEIFELSQLYFNGNDAYSQNFNYFHE